MVDDRLSIHPPLVRRLVNAQFPQWRDLDIRPVQTNGWDNTTFRLGEKMKVRLPTATRYVAQVEKEYRWLPYLAPFLPVPIPVPIALGSPTEDYPFPWSICSWIEGDLASSVSISDRNTLAKEVAQFLVVLQQTPPDQGPQPGSHNFFRGGSLRVYDSEVQECLERLQRELNPMAVKSAWGAALASQHEARGVWVHGDVAANNLLVAEGHLRGVIDFGCSAVGDPACDLVIAWTFFEGQNREIFRSKIGADRGTWSRARGWALWKALLQLSELGSENAGNATVRIIEDVVSEHEREEK
jgi:aminoglycoside phosphotransferase (APT) family kinase protein